MFPQYANGDNEIEKDKFIELCGTIDVATPYAGTVAKVPPSSLRYSAC